MRGKAGRKGVMIGVYDEAEVAAELTQKYRGRKARRIT